MKLPNFRDLGGLSTKEGKKIKSKRLLRSSALVSLDEKTIKSLTLDYNVKQILDLRRIQEVTANPNISIDNTTYSHIDILEDIPHTPLNPFVENISKEIAQTHMKAFYIKFLSASKKYKEFISAILNHTEGSTLFHCVHGKDRTGFGTVILLKILGVSDDDIYNDYLKTITLMEEYNKNLLNQHKQSGCTTNQLDALNVLYNVEKDYLENLLNQIDEEYKSFDNFVKEVLCITEDEIEQLKDMYLE